MRKNKAKLHPTPLQWEGRSSWRSGHINVFFLPNTLSFGVEHEIKCRLSEDYILIAFQAVSFRQQGADRTARTSPHQKHERELSSRRLTRVCVFYKCGLLHDSRQDFLRASVCWEEAARNLQACHKLKLKKELRVASALQCGLNKYLC